MDLLIADNSVPLGQADVAPVTGTPQYATNGNPVTNTPATDLPAYEFNAVISEIVGTIVGGGLAPDRTNNAQLLAAINKLIIQSAPTGQCQLQCASAAELILAPLDGNIIRIAGVNYPIPAVGIDAANAGILVNGAIGNLGANTVYYVSCYNNGGALALAFWNAATYGRMPDTTAGNVGTEVISAAGAPMSAHTLVGKIYTNALSQFSDAPGARYTLSWFNRLWKASKTTFAAQRSTTSGTVIEINSEIRNGFISWAEEIVRFGLVGIVSLSSTSFGTAGIGIGFDGTIMEPDNVDITNPVSSPAVVDDNASFRSAKSGLSDVAAHYATLLAYIQTGSLSAISFANASAAPGGIQVVIEIRG